MRCELQAQGQVREVLEFEYGVRAIGPVPRGGAWRLRWCETGQRRDTSARTRDHAIAKAIELVERLGRGIPTALARSTGDDLVAHYLDPRRRPPRVDSWSDRHRDEQVRYCERHIIPIIGAIPCRCLTRVDFQRIVDQASTASVGNHLMRCVTALVHAGLEEGHIVARQDLLRGVRWGPPTGTERTVEPAGCAITDNEIPTATAVHNLAAAAAETSRVWWRELEILLVAYSGLRWGEHVALTADRVDIARRRITVDRQIIESRGTLKPALPKGRRRRVTMYPATIPGGDDLGKLVQRRLDELAPDGLLFPAPHGGWARRSNYGRNTWTPAAVKTDWPRTGDGRWHWTFHSLRHVFATWALHQPGLRIEDVSRLLGHSSVRVTQDIYIHVQHDIYQRFFDATE